METDIYSIFPHEQPIARNQLNLIQNFHHNPSKEKIIEIIKYHQINSTAFGWKYYMFLISAIKCNKFNFPEDIEEIINKVKNNSEHKVKYQKTLEKIMNNNKLTFDEIDYIFYLFYSTGDEIYLKRIESICEDDSQHITRQMTTKLFYNRIKSPA